MTENFTIFTEKKKALTPVFRGGYVNFFEPKAFDVGDKPEWGMQLMLPKAGPGVEDFTKALKGIYVQVLLDKFTTKEKAIEMGNLIGSKKRFPVRDGDNTADTSGLANSEQLIGHYFMNANNKFRQPTFIGPAGKGVPAEQLSQDDIYSGAHYRAMLEFWYYDVKGNKGIGCSLAAFMKVKDDANLGAGTTIAEAEDAFSGFASEAVSEGFDEAVAEGSETATGGSPEGAADEFNFM